MATEKNVKNYRLKNDVQLKVVDDLTAQDWAWIDAVVAKGKDKLESERQMHEINAKAVQAAVAKALAEGKPDPMVSVIRKGTRVMVIGGQDTSGQLGFPVAKGPEQVVLMFLTDSDNLEEIP